MALRGGSSPFVGRASELAVLEGLFRSLEDRGAAAVLVAGEAGMGKSRLVEQIGVRAEQRGATVAVGRTTVAGASLPYGAIVALFRSLQRRLDGSAERRRLEAAQAVLLADGSEVTRQVTRVGLFEAVLAAVDELAAAGPVVLVLEDLHWADTGSVEVVDHLVRNLDHQPVLLVVTHRDDELVAQPLVQRVLAELRRHPSVVPVDLHGLGRTEVAELAVAVTGEEQPWVVVDAVYERSGGNPLFAEELVALRDRGSVPPVLRDLLRVRLGELEPPARPLVAAAAVIGTAAPAELLARVAGLDGAALDDAVAAGVRGGALVTERPGRLLRFRHALLRDVAHDELLPAERAALHRKAAEVLTAEPELCASGPGAAAAQLAVHHFEAGDWPAACATSIIAAQAAMHVYSAYAAHVHLQRALDAHHRAAGACDHPEVDQAELHHRASGAAALVSEPERACRHAEAAFAAVDPGEEPLRWARYGTALARCAWDGRSHEVGFRVLQDVTTALRALPESAELSEALTMRARLLMASGRFAESVVACRDAVALARLVGDRTSEGHALATLGPSLAGLGDGPGATEAVEAACRVAEHVGDADLLLRAYTNLGDVHLTAGELEKAAAVVAGATDAPDGQGLIRLSAAGQNSAEALVALGRWDEAADVLAATARCSISVCSSAVVVESLLALRRGELELAERTIAGRELTSVQALLQRELVLAEIELERGRPDVALTAVDRAFDLLAGTSFTIEAFRAHALALRALGDQADMSSRGRRSGDRPKLERVAALTLTRAEDMLRARAGAGPVGPWVSALASLCRAEASRVTGPDPAAWASAAAVYGTFGDPYHHAYCTFRQAEALLGDRARRRRAGALLEEAWCAGGRLGAPTLVARCEQLASRARVPLDAVSAESVGRHRQVREDLGLTAREVEVLALLADDRTDAQIAEHLFISKKTASVHVSNLLRKLGVDNRWEAGELARGSGLDPTS